jgi:hypothetical protein
MKGFIMYATINFKTKKELKQAIADGKHVGVFSPGPFPCGDNGKMSVDGPHYPLPHRWYAEVFVENGRIIKVY